MAIENAENERAAVEKQDSTADALRQDAFPSKLGMGNCCGEKRDISSDDIRPFSGSSSSTAESLLQDTWDEPSLGHNNGRGHRGSRMFPYPQPVFRKPDVYIQAQGEVRIGTKVNY